MRRDASLATLALAAGLLAFGCGPSPGDVEVPAGTPVVLISIDTLRSDHLPAYGYTGVKTPAIDGLREESILFEHAFSHSPLTLPSHTSLLTGRLPSEHGVRDNMGYPLDAAAGFYLPRALGAAGYHTGATVSTAVLDRSSGLAEGFDLYDDDMGTQRDFETATAQRSGDVTLEAARQWVDSVRGEPFFLFFHIYEPHAPYEPPADLAGRFASPYDGEIAAADRIVGRLLDHLRELDLYDRALVVLLSDHGEGLGDHGIEEHGLLLYREALQVPLLLKLPDGVLGGETVDDPVQLVDLVPTLARLLGVEAPADLPGRSLLAVMAGDAPEAAIYAETQFPLLHFGWSPLASLIRYPYHLIEGPDPELYDLAQDPAEARDLAPKKTGLLASLRQEITGFATPFDAPAAVDAETRRRLGALGYVGAAAPVPEGTALADPKSRLHVVEALTEAHRLYREGELERAVERYREVLAAEPRLIDAWENLGHARFRLGRPAEALEAYRHLLELTAGAPAAVLDAARALTRLGRFEEAQDYALQAAEAEPEAYDLLTRIALQQDDLEHAERYVDASIAARGELPGPLLLRAEILERRGEHEGAIEVTRRIEEIAAGEAGGKVPLGLFRLRGEALASLGRADEAAAAFQREIEVFPDDLEAYSHLAVLRALQGDGPGTGLALRRMVEANPTAAAYALAVKTLGLLGDPGSAARLLAYARQRWPDDPALRGLGASS
jgi:arylsulfatase A-like enzyme/Flp pilus assembly protein TadD